MLQEMVGPFHSEFYVINGMLLESRKRREHLSEEDLQKNKAIMESFTKGNTQGFDNNGEVQVNLLLLVYYSSFGCIVLTCVVAYLYIAVL
jgi:Protein of unknown function (DUF3424).